MAEFRLRLLGLGIVFLVFNGTLSAQTQLDTTATVTAHIKDSIPQPVDTALRIINLNPYITLHVDSAINYNLDINRDSSKYFWFLKNAPVGLKINKDNGELSFKAEKSYFLSGRLKYDQDYKVFLGVQNLADPKQRVDTSFTLVFYNTEITLSKVKPTINSTVYIDEGDTLSFRVQCDNGSFPLENISALLSIPIKNYTQVKKCDDEFRWPVPFDFIKDTDKDKEKSFVISLVGADKFFNRDTANIKVIVRDALNYPFRLQEYNKLVHDINRYIIQLKFTFKELDKKVKGTKNTRTSFDLASGTSALGGTVLATSASTGTANVGKVMPSVGVALVPVKEAVSPVKSYEQNSASQVRANIKRLEYSLSDNSLSGERDAFILDKVAKLKTELKQVQVQLVDVPMLDTGEISEEELNQYFNSPKVNKKYKLSRK